MMDSRVSSRTPGPVGRVWRTWIVGLAACLLLVSLPAVALGGPGGGATPDEAWQAARSALEAQAWQQVVESVAPSERVMFAWSIDFGVGMVAEMWEGEQGAKVKKAYAAARERFEVPDPDDLDIEPLRVDSDTPQSEVDAHLEKKAELEFGGIDAVGYIAALLEILVDNGGMEGEGPLPLVDLTGVEIDGDSANGVLGEQPVKFLREGGRWYLSGEAFQ